MYAVACRSPELASVLNMVMGTPRYADLVPDSAAISGPPSRYNVEPMADPHCVATRKTHLGW